MNLLKIRKMADLQQYSSLPFPSLCLFIPSNSYPPSPTPLFCTSHIPLFYYNRLFKRLICGKHYVLNHGKVIIPMYHKLYEPTIRPWITLNRASQSASKHALYKYVTECSSYLMAWEVDSRTLPQTVGWDFLHNKVLQCLMEPGHKSSPYKSVA